MTAALTDTVIKCVVCGHDFTHSVKEQEFFIKKGLTHVPKRCPACRVIKRETRSAPGRPGWPGAEHDIVCDNCGKPDRVPFTPTPGRPVLCKSCYQAVRRAAGGDL